jgi:ribosomal protein S27E
MQEHDDTYLTCPECGKHAVAYRIKDDSMLCRICGNRWSSNITIKDIDLTKQYTHPKCPRCGGLWVSYSSKSNSLICRKCGKRWPRTAIGEIK